MAEYLTHYGGLVWTNHALERLKQRKCPQNRALEAFQAPDRVLEGKNPGTKEYIKKIDIYTITLIVKFTEDRKWLVISNWVEPPFPGSYDIKKKERYQKYLRSGSLGRLWMRFMRDIFGMEF